MGGEFIYFSELQQQLVSRFSPVLSSQSSSGPVRLRSFIRRGLGGNANCYSKADSWRAGKVGSSHEPLISTC